VIGRICEVRIAVDNHPGSAAETIQNGQHMYQRVMGRVVHTEVDEMDI